jgi:hypothetical protein
MDSLLIEGRVRSPLVERFGARRLYERHHLTSLMCFMGLLTIGPSIEGETTMEVPNQVVRGLHWEELALLLREQAGVHIETLDLQAAVSRMAYHGEIDPFLALLRDGVLKVLSNRDLMKFDEKHLKMVMLTYLSMSPIFRPLSEKEFAQGYGDLFLALDQRFPDARYAYLIELKHLHGAAGDEEITAARDEAEAQLQRYLADQGLLPALTGGRALKALARSLRAGPLRSHRSPAAAAGTGRPGRRAARPPGPRAPGSAGPTGGRRPLQRPAEVLREALDKVGGERLRGQGQSSRRTPEIQRPEEFARKSLAAPVLPVERTIWTGPGMGERMIY